MKRENIVLIAGIVIFLLIVIIGFSAVKSASGVDPPFTVVESQSMQHSNESEIGIIDTADMMLVKDPDKTHITTFVEGYASGEKHFGDYGSVIIYKRDTGNPVIHRAILYLEYNNNKWSGPSLDNFGNNWYCPNSTDTNSLSGILILRLPGEYRDVDSISINLDTLSKQSGFITMGDNNNDIDQNSLNISYNQLVGYERIKSVAWKEIPWIGALKLISNGNKARVDANVPNTIPNLAAFFITIILIIMAIGFVFDEIVYLKKRQNTPTPPFPLELEKENER